MGKYLTIDVGGTAIKYALMDEEANIQEKGEEPTPMEGLEVYLDTLEKIYRKYDGQVEAVCMSAPGRIDAQKGYFYTGGALTYIHEINLAEALKDRIPVPFTAENDAKAAALAELWKGSMKGVTNGTVVVLGTGIGGALIINGALYRGSTFAAGEYSCMGVDLVKPYGEGLNWALTASTTGLIAAYARHANADPKELNGRIIFDKVNAGDPVALETLNEFCLYVYNGIISLQTVIDVERVAIGGGISKQPVLIETIRKVAKEQYEKLPGYYPMSLPEIVPCTFGNDANMIGALYHYLHEVKQG